ncbi:hypothetical protein E4U38_006242 [Claviceps purpurea]|nr:hypothetical protein E4U38_006242 [Claviceps purpurea]
MRYPPPRTTYNVIARNIRGSAITSQRPRCSFHLSAPASLSRYRSFFTSNPLLSSNPAENPSEASPSPSSPSSSSSTTDARPKGQASTPKRKKPRSATAKTSLRRVAIIAQDPKRSPDKSNAAETDANQLTTISATCIADSFNMPLVVEILSSHGFAIDPDDTGFDANEVVHAKGVNGGDIFVFPSGTVVTWSLPSDVVTKQILRAAEDAHPPELREVEDLDFETDTSRAESAMKGDKVVLGMRKEHRDGDTRDTTLAKIAFSSGLARSTNLAVLETAFMHYFESTRHIPAILSQGSGLPLGRKFILQKTGELLSLRARLNHYSELTDSLPDIFWDSKSELGLEGYYDQVGRALDVNVRIRTLNQKMDYAQEIATVLREMSSEQHGTRLEVIIIVLIFVEVIFEVRRIVLEWSHDEVAIEGGGKRDAAMA